MKNFNQASAGNYALEKALHELDLADTLGLVGNIYVVANTTEQNLVAYYNRDRTYDDGSTMMQSTLAAAYAKTVSNRNDVIFLSSNGTSNKVTAILTVVNNRVHFIGLDPNGRKVGARAMISNTGAGAATDTAMVKITGTGCSFHNLALKDNWTAAENVSSVCDWGNETFWENCDIEALGSAHLSNANAASLILGGDECIYKNCTIGQDTLLITSTAGQDLLVQNRGTTATKTSRDRFDDCRFQTWTSDTTHVFVRAGANTIDRDIMFNNCEFVNTSTTATSGVAMAVVAATNASVGGSMYFNRPAIFRCTDLATAAVGATNVFVVSPVLAAAASDCVGVQSS